MDAAEAHRACQTTGSKGGRTLVARALAKVEKKIHQEGWTLVFVDESGFYLLPMVIRSYAPRGLTPLLKEFLSRDHLAVLGAITPQGKLFLSTHSQAISTQEVIEFLGLLQKRIPGRLLILWDNSPTHRSKKLKAYLAQGAARRLHLEQLPSYAPELNPIEWIWSYMKVVQLANVACDTLPQLERLVQQGKRRLQNKPDLIKSFIQHVGYRL